MMRLVLRNDQDKAEIGENIRLAREAQGLSQDDLADIVGTTRKAVSRYETGTQEMGIVTFCQYAEALQASPEQLFPRRLYKPEGESKMDQLNAIAKTLSDGDLDLLLMMAERLRTGKT